MLEEVRESEETTAVNSPSWEHSITYQLRQEDEGVVGLWGKPEGRDDCRICWFVAGVGLVLAPNVDPEVWSVDEAGYCVLAR